MEYIHSKDIFLLMRDTLKLIDRRVMDHGSRVAYYLYKMLECKGGYEKFELADFILLASMHDIGAYKTENLKEMVRYECKETIAHATYGYLVFKHLSPLSELAPIILYHHTDHSQMKSLNYEYKDIAEALNLVEKIDIFSTALKDKFDINMFRKQAGTVVSREALELFEKAAGQSDVLKKVRNGEFKEELDDAISYMIYNNEDKKRFIEMLTYCQGLKSEIAVVDAVGCMCIAESMGQKAGLTELESEQLYYGALLHDMGMLAIPKEITEAQRTLSEEEYEKVKMHVHLAEKVLKDRMADEVVEIVAAHHERCDGSGYPRGLREIQMNRNQQIVQLADAVTALMEIKTYRPPYKNSEVQAIIKKEAAAGKFNKSVANLFLDNYDAIMENARARADETMSTYKKLNQQYRHVSKKINER